MQVPTRHPSAVLDRGPDTPGTSGAGSYQSGPSRPQDGKPRKNGTKRPRRPRKDPLWARLVVIFGALLMVFSGGSIVGAKALVGQATGTIAQDNLLGGAGKTSAEGGSNLDGPIDMLLLGVDIRQSWEPNDTRADSIVILHIPSTHDQAYLISIPRDLDAQIPPFSESGFAGGSDKINSAFYHGAQGGAGWSGGAQLMAKTIKSLTGISFDGAAIIDFGGFRGVINELGGVRMCVDQQVTSAHMSMVDGKQMWNADAKKTGKTRTPVVYKKGCQTMNGTQALDYSRQRYGLKNGDYDRQRHQQQMIKAIAKKAMDGGIASNPLKINQLIKSAGKAFTLDTGGVAIDNFIFTLRGVTANDMMLLRTNNGTFNGNSSGKEELNELTLRMFDALKRDQLSQFVIENPEIISTS